MPYLDSADILELNPDIVKFVLSLSEEEQIDYHVAAGWLLIPCSGQVYGNIGHTVMATDWHLGKVFTNHILGYVRMRKSGAATFNVCSSTLSWGVRKL
jgi:type I restriction enzyme S subunit